MKGVFAVIKVFAKAIIQTLSLALRKLPAMAGGLLPLALALGAALIMFFTAHHALNAKAPTALTLAYVDNSGTELSRELIAAIERSNGASVRFFQCQTAEQANAMSDDGAVEGILIIGSSLEEELRNGKAALDYLPAKGASSAQAARELIAGEAVTLGSMLRAESYFEKLTGNAPSAEEKLKLYDAYTAELSREGSAVERITVFSGANNEKTAETNLFSAFFARYSGFSSFVIMLILLMLGAFSGSRDEKNCMERISTYFLGRSMGFLSSLGALMLIGLILLALSFIPSGGASLLQIVSGTAYVFCASALSLLLGSLSGSARAELASPLVAFLTALAGGCFTDTSALGPGFKALSRCTPQGQYLASLGGEAVFIPVLFALGIILLLLSRLLSNAAKRAVQAR